MNTESLTINYKLMHYSAFLFDTQGKKSDLFHLTYGIYAHRQPNIRLFLD